MTKFRVTVTAKFPNGHHETLWADMQLRIERGGSVDLQNLFDSIERLVQSAGETDSDFTITMRGMVVTDIS
jgi:hypothetical protein